MNKELRNLKVFGFGWALIIPLLIFLRLYELRPTNVWFFIGGICVVLFVISQSVGKRLIYEFCFWVLSLFLIFAEKRLTQTETWQMSFLGLMGLAFFFYVMASWKSNLLKPLYIPWMKIVHVIGGFFTIVVFTFVFYFVFTPISLMLKCLKKDLLKSKMNKGQSSYWHARDLSKENKDRYQKQY